MKMKAFVILIAGPTASGKSKLAIKLAKSLNCEIINADSMQVYKEFNILTSRPSKNDERKIKHHLYGIISVKKSFSVGDWLKLATKKINKVLKKGKTVIIVGGTGLYFKALLDGLVEIPNIPKSYRDRIRNDHKKLGQKKFYKKLLKLDPYVKRFISENDSHRSLRAYEVKKFTKKSLYLWFKNTKSNFPEGIFKKIFLNTPRIKLIEKINLRVDKMFKQGAQLEVKNFLKKKIKQDMSAHRIIGVKEISKHLSKKLSLDEAKNLIKIRTRQYAKRQFTWARGKMTSWEKIEPLNYKKLLKTVIK